MPRTSVLVVDDHDVVRKGLCQILSSVPDWDIICEATSGEEAVEKAKEHLPGVILLDITLPGINGLEAACRIRCVSPTSLILFISQHNCIQMVREAFGAGGRGYLLKSNAGLELVEAIRTVLGGNQFVSKSLAFS